MVKIVRLNSGEEIMAKINVSINKKIFTLSCTDGDETRISNVAKLFESKLNDLIYVFGKHGKSKQMGVWSLKELIESNRQLKKCDDIKCNSSEFNRPLDGDISKTLGSKYIIFS
jgi:cell division protein ZapA (FtsZ GTPase activity inhibitor)